MKYRKKPVIVDAVQWFKNRDHPAVSMQYIWYDPACKCKHCNIEFGLHGVIKTLEGEHTVCPGDWVITGVNGEHYPCKPDVFEKTYDVCE